MCVPPGPKLIRERRPFVSNLGFSVCALGWKGKKRRFLTPAWLDLSHPAWRALPSPNSGAVAREGRSEQGSYTGTLGAPPWSVSFLLSSVLPSIWKACGADLSGVLIDTGYQRGPRLTLCVLGPSFSDLTHSPDIREELGPLCLRRGGVGGHRLPRVG